MSVDGVGQVAFEGASCLVRGLGLGEFAPIVGASGAGVADLADGDDVQGGIQLPVAAAVEAVAALCTCCWPSSTQAEPPAS